MYTFCPHCFSVFRVSAAHLGKAGGLARCGECRQIYSVIDYLYEDLTTARMALAEVEVDAKAGAATAEADAAAMPGPGPGVEAVMEDEWDDTDAASLPGRPVFTGSREQQPLFMKDIISGAGIGVLLLLLGMQWVYFNRADLAGNAGWRPALENFCELLRCELPLRTDLARLQIIQRDVRQHPVVEDALLINATFENRAAFTQPYPVFEISFSNHSGVPVAVRRFLPAEYLPEGSDPGAGLASNVPLQVLLEVLDPGEAAASFQFGFL